MIINFETHHFLAHDFPRFLRSWGGGGTTLCLPAQVFEDPTLGPLDEASTDLMLGVWAKIGTAGIGDSPSKPGIESMKLYRACNEAYQL
jgi:hypothetical protein